ncbi:hypothetical protein [Flammeovirga sp. EKP202]|uniref:hypothetical protein n=1 Tax=Flammeovirga sp. EKP202 TaxID=2770592 RepID=UPI00165EC8E0|nr:hypothetical protein [Flammeovirga sp. EKP202]MBD0403544.1 hypothetical protein [Flammeovirga sp. EKP202]
MKTICKPYQNPITPKKWMTALTGVSYLLISTILYFRPFSDVYAMTMSFGIILLPSAFLDIYFSSDNKAQIFSWGFLLLNAVADLMMSIVFIAHSYLDHSILLYFGSFWILGKGMVTLNFSSLIKKERIIKYFYVVTSLTTIVLSMLLVINVLFSEIQIDKILTLAMLLCAINKFISVFFINKEHYKIYS